MERWHYSKWKVMVPEEFRSDFERFFSGRGFTVKRWVNYVPDIDGDPEKIMKLTEEWIKSSNRVQPDVDYGQAQEIAAGALTQKKTLQETPVDGSASVQFPKKRPKRSKKGGA